jgi:NADH-quinone oxidoreductase subunit E
MLRLGFEDDDESEGETSYTTDDMRFTVRTVACFGQCALAPVIAVDDVIHSRMTSEKLEDLLKKLTAKKSGKK